MPLFLLKASGAVLTVGALTLLVFLARASARRVEPLRIPAVVVELAWGLLIVNVWFLVSATHPQVSQLSRFWNGELVHALAELGVLLLLFQIGIETHLETISRTGQDAGRVAVAGVILPIVFALLALQPQLREKGLGNVLFLSAALSATSIGISARVLRDGKRLKTASGQIILGAAVLDDILGIILLAMVSAIASRGILSAPATGALLGKIGLFLLGAWIFHRFLLAHYVRALGKMRGTGVLGAALILSCLVSAWLAQAAALAGIVGAFTLGLLLHDSPSGKYSGAIAPLTSFLAPLFFIAMGMKVNLSALFGQGALGLTLILIVCAVLGKLLAGFVISRNSRRAGAERAVIGLGMIPRGEVGLIFASLGMDLHVLSASDSSALIMMVLVTTLLAPILLSVWLARAGKAC